MTLAGPALHSHQLVAIDLHAVASANLNRLLWPDRTRTKDRPAPIDYESFFRDSYPRLLRRLSVLCAGDPALAEDIAQEAFLAAYQRWDCIGALDHPYAYVKTMAARLAFRWLKKKAKHTAELTADLLDLARETLSDIPMLIDVQRALATLSRRRREVATLRILLDLEPVEIGEVLGIEAGTVRAHLHAARKTLETRLEGPYL